jgi:hypothetical protein
MTFKDRPGQIVKLATTRPAGVPLAMGLIGVMPAFNDLSSTTGRTLNARGLAQLADHFIALGVINQRLNVYEHGIHRLTGMMVILPQVQPSPRNTGRAFSFIVAILSRKSRSIQV